MSAGSGASSISTFAICVHGGLQGVGSGSTCYELNPDKRPKPWPRTWSRLPLKACPIDMSPMIEGREAKGGIIRPSGEPLESRVQKWPEAIYLWAHHTRLLLHHPSPLRRCQRSRRGCQRSRRPSGPQSASSPAPGARRRRGWAGRPLGPFSAQKPAMSGGRGARQTNAKAPAAGMQVDLGAMPGALAAAGSSRAARGSSTHPLSMKSKSRAWRPGHRSCHPRWDGRAIARGPGSGACARSPS